ncbi:hypothetical protein TWF481_012105 [Arthrobotrys musiformis]|uniref:F-box domain-containing protein n=1 Tax=Arthrobotrys musiformis TaxID=47236 RepID=A0AAV9VX66_9PEZI
MFIPPEILLNIVEELKTDRDTLHNLRLVNKYFCQVATDILFGNFNLHYGFRHSIPQMKAIIKSPGLQPFIRSLDLPSESFFPIAKNFSWRSGGSYKFEWSRVLSKKVDPPTRINCYEQQTDSAMYRGYQEVPTNSNARFTFAVKRYKKEYETYMETLTAFLRKCVNLRAIHITTGLGYEAERSQKWCEMVRSAVFPILAHYDIKKFEISVAAGECFWRMIEGYEHGETTGDNTPGFPSVTSLAIKVHHETSYGHWYGEPPDRSNRFNCFLSAMPNLTTYSISRADLRRRSFYFLPTSFAHLTSLNMRFMNFDEEGFNNFKAMVTSIKALTDLTLDAIVLCLPANLQLERYTERRHPIETAPASGSTSNTLVFGDARPPNPGPFDAFLDSGNSFNFDPFDAYSEEESVPTYALTDLSPTMTWKCTFDIFREQLPNLTEFSFKRLLYCNSCLPTSYDRNVLLYIPVQDSEHYNRTGFQKFARGTRDMELISPLVGDYFALGRLRGTVNENRRKYGLPELKYAGKSEGFGKNSGSDTFNLKDEIPGFEHQTKNNRIILLEPYDLWRNDSPDEDPENHNLGFGDYTFGGFRTNSRRPGDLRYQEAP